MKPLCKLASVSFLSLALVACGVNSGKTISAYINVIGTVVTEIIAQELPAWSGAANLKTLFAKASADAAAWVPGTPSQDLVQAMGDLGDALDSVPLGTNADNLIALGVSAVDGIIAIVDSSKTSSALNSGMVSALLDQNLQHPAKVRKHVYSGKRPSNVKEFKKAWNKAAPKHAKV